MKAWPLLLPAALACGGVAWFGRRDAPPAPSAQTPIAAVSPAPQRADAQVAAASVPAAPTPTVASACPHQQIDLRIGENVEHACVSDTRSVQSGSVRNHVVEPEGLSSWRMRISVAEGRVAAARVWSAAPLAGAAPPAVYGCARGACKGIAIGPPDPHGARSLVLRDVLLMAPGAPQGSPPTLRASATLRLVPERQIPGLACDVPALTVIDNTGSLIDFCALGGAGFEVADDGHRSYQFRDLEGRILALRLALDGTIDQVTLGKLACTAPACGGVSTSVRGDAASPGAERSFTFSGTTLRSGDHAASRSVTLSGIVTMPSQDE